MEIKFFGAARMVTGSNYLVKTKKYNFLIDCGMFQGSEEKEILNRQDFPYNPKEIDYLILTHAHIDHSGRIPKLVKEGFRGKIICSKPTYDLCKIMLIDSAKIQESDIEWENRKRNRSGRTPIEPLYTMEEAEYSLKFFETYLNNQKISLNEDLQIRFRDAGHILGSSILEIWVKEEGDISKIVFSGDLGMPGRPIINNPEYIDEADYLIIESTYGDTIHESYKDSTDELISIINQTVLKGGTVIIPSFAVGRTQEMIYELNKYYEYDKEVQDYMRVPIYLDSPMAIDATEAFQKNASSFNSEAKELILKGNNPFIFDNLRYVRSQEESMALNKSVYPKVIISASGMATAGRIRHHLKHNLWNENNSLIFVGYQAEGTLGRILLNGAKKVKILGEDIEVQANIYNLEGFSGHADQKFLLHWISKFKVKPKKIFVVHGEIDACERLSQLINDKFKIKTIIPQMNDSFNIHGSEIEVTKESQIENDVLRKDIEDEFKDVSNQFNFLVDSLENKFDDKILEKNYDIIKNKLIELQQKLMDLHIILSK